MDEGTETRFETRGQITDVSPLSLSRAGELQMTRSLNTVAPRSSTQALSLTTFATAVYQPRHANHSSNHLP